MKLRLAILAALAVLFSVVAPAASASTGLTFKTVCSLVVNPAEPWAEDPILHPNVPPPIGPNQEYFGNTGTNYSSTGQSLQVNGAAIHTTCANRFDTAAYYVPTVYRDGVRVAPSGQDAYYQGHGANQPVTEFPVDFRMMAGDPNRTTPQPVSVVKWGCIATPSSFTSAPVACPDNGTGANPLVVTITFPGCWDGQNDRTANHTNKVAVWISNGTNPVTCPTAYPVFIPRVFMTVHYDHPTLPDCHLVGTPQPGVNCYVYTVSTGPSPSQDQGSIYAMNAKFLDGWSDGPDTVDSPNPLDFADMIRLFDNAPNGSNASCDDTCSMTNPPGDSFTGLYN